MKKYSIGEIAAKHGVTASFLKYYEQQGLITPQTAANGYRSYTLKNLSSLSECIRLKNLGFSAREIQVLLQEADYPQMLDLLKERQEDLRRQSLYLDSVQNYYRRMAAELPAYENSANWSIGPHGDFYYFPQSIGDHYLDDPRADALSADWIRWMPVTLNTACVDYRSPDGTEVMWGLSLDASFARAIGVLLDGPVTYFPRCRCLEFWDKRELTSPQIMREQMFIHMQEIIRKYHLTVIGPSYFFVRTRLHENGKRYTYQKVLTPIE